MAISSFRGAGAAEVSIPGVLMGLFVAVAFLRGVLSVTITALFQAHCRDQFLPHVVQAVGAQAFGRASSRGPMPEVTSRVFVVEDVAPVGGQA